MIHTPLSESEIRAAFEADLQQYLTQTLNPTPGRFHITSIDHVQKLVRGIEQKLEKFSTAFYQAVANAGSCGACAEVIACGSTMYEHVGCSVAERDAALKSCEHFKCVIGQLTTELAASNKEKDEFVAQLKTEFRKYAEHEGYCTEAQRESTGCICGLTSLLNSFVSSTPVAEPTWTPQQTWIGGEGGDV